MKHTNEYDKVSGGNFVAKHYKYPEVKPPAPLPTDDDFIVYPLQSEKVLCWDGDVWLVGYLEVWDEGEEIWKQLGRDGYIIEGVTHWMPLPEAIEPKK